MFIKDVAMAFRCNWGAPDKFDRLGMMIRNAGLDLYYAGRILSAPSVRPAGEAWDSDQRSEALDYGVLKKITPHFLVEPNDVMVEVGCGLGRVLLWWNVLGLKNRMIGIEKNPQVAKAAAHLFRRYPNVEIRLADGAEEIPPEGTFYFMNNALNPEGVALFQHNLKRRALDLKKVRVLYCLARHQAAFSTEQGWTRHTIDAGIVRSWNPLVRIVPT